MAKPPTLEEVLGELGAGMFVEKLTESLKMAALGTIQTGKKGSVTMHLELEQIGNSSSVQVKHTLKYAKPTMRGKMSEEDTTSTPMHVDTFGNLTINPQTQDDIFSVTSNVTKIGGNNG